MAYLLHCDAPNCTKSMELDDPAYGDWIDVSLDYVGSSWSNADAAPLEGHACKPAHVPDAAKWLLTMIGDTPTDQQKALEAEAKSMMAQPDPINMPPQPSMTNPAPQVPKAPATAPAKASVKAPAAASKAK